MSTPPSAFIVGKWLIYAAFGNPLGIFINYNSYTRWFTALCMTSFYETLHLGTEHTMSMFSHLFDRASLI